MSEIKTNTSFLLTLSLGLAYVLIDVVDIAIDSFAPSSFLVEYGRYVSLALIALYVYVAYKLNRWLTNRVPQQSKRMSEFKTFTNFLLALALAYVLFDVVDIAIDFFVPSSFLVEYGRYVSLALIPPFVYVAYWLYRWLTNRVPQQSK